MSSGPNPHLSAFIRGTSDSAHVFFLEGGVRRPIPDEETLKRMLAGAAVRVLSDADLAAIPLGPSLPSRRDGLLVTVSMPVPPPNPVIYFLTDGQRRRVPDIQTLLGFQNQGNAALRLPAADLNAIPEGAALPSRRDGLVYRGSAGVFAFVMQSGQKRAIPNATTLRDAGHDVATLAEINAIDLAHIPVGPPFPTSSRFLSPPSSEIPLLLLPVRLETRFQGTELWLRIYPDDIHIDSFEPELTEEERRARAAYLAQLQAAPDDAKTAFATLARQFGSARAAWIVTTNAPDSTKPDQWTRAPFTNVLPERWVVLGYQGNAAANVLAVGPAIPESLPVGPAPGVSGPLADEGMRWTIDFDRAITAGMAFRIPLTPVQQRGFKRVVVLGLKTQLSAQDSAARLTDLLQAHHFTDGLELLAHNTPTNNAGDVEAGFSSRETGYDAAYARELGPSLCPTRPSADGDRVAAILNIPPVTFSHVRGANGGQEEQARAMNQVLWPATWGYYLNQIVNGAVPNPDVLLPACRDHFAAHVRARGHFPALRVGRQPYGLLPVCSSAQWKPIGTGPLETPLSGLLATLRTTWENSLGNVPRVPGAADPESALVNLLSMTPSSTSFVARNVVGPEYNFSYWNFVQQDLPKTWWTALASRALTDTGDLASVLSTTRLASVAFSKQHRVLSDVLVAAPPLDGLAAPPFLAQFAMLGWQALRDVDLPAPPIPLLFLLLRHAILREYMDTALELLTEAGAAQPQEGIEAELLGFSVLVRPTAWDLLQRDLPGKGPVGAFLDGARADSTLPSFSGFWRAFQQLAQCSAAELDAATREVFDLASYRLDAWITSLAHARLESLRTARPNGGIVLGAYGWLENVKPQPQQTASQGFVHAPSIQQATTAAVLRSGYLAHSTASPRPFEIDLSSGRVRLALHLLDGIREGQPLGALLGYRLERTLHDAKLDPLIDKLRTIAPFESGAGPLDVVDGLLLWRKFNADATILSGPGFPVDGTEDRRLMLAAMRLLGDALDSVADLTLAESVHQLTRGNTLRAGATLDSIARGDTPPPELEFVNTPRSGTALTYRLLTVASSANPAGWTLTVRAKGEPRLNAWAAAVLGDPAKVRIRGRSVGAAGSLEIGLDRLDLAPLDLLALPEAEGIPAELASRIRRAFAPLIPAGAAIEIVTGRDPNWRPDVIALPEWLALLNSTARLIHAARPIEPRDLVTAGDPTGAYDADELQTRATAAEVQLRADLAALQSASAQEAALLAASAYGVADSIPDPDPAKVPAQIAAAVLDLAARVAQLDKLAAGFTRIGMSAADQVPHDTSRLQAIFGSSFRPLPVLAPATAAGWTQMWSRSLSLQAGDPLSSVRWFQRMARVRPGAGLLDSAMMLSETLAGKTMLQFQVAQLPGSATDRWIALESPEAPSANRLSLVAFSPVPLASGAPVAGLILDEWTEVCPSVQQMTGVSFQYTDPAARAPQSILLGVRPDDFPEWTLETVEGTILEALALAKIRAVDPDSLGALGHYLPALYFAYNTGSTGPEVVSTDFGLVTKAQSVSHP